MQIWCLWCVWNNVLKPAVQSVIFVSIKRSPPPLSPPSHYSLWSCVRLSTECASAATKGTTATTKKPRWHQLVQHTKNNDLPHKLHWCFRAHCAAPRDVFLCMRATWGQRQWVTSSWNAAQKQQSHSSQSSARSAWQTLHSSYWNSVTLFSPPCCLYYHETHTRTQTQTHCWAEMRLKFSTRSVQKLRGNSPKARSHRDLNTLSDYFLFQINTGT